ncbi:MAG: hypothetical protein IT220_03325 [Flavobacteriaceae bacterium]|nr:hypothetical protein [Flavobacteriaceae bacterium]
MKKLNFISIIIGLFIILSSFISIEHNSSDQDPKVAKGNEYAILLGNALKEKYHQDLIIQYLQKVDEGYSEELSFAFLANNPKLVKINEIGFSVDPKFTEMFVQSLDLNLKDINTFPILNKELSTKFDKGLAVLNSLSNEKLQIIFNYEDKKVDLSKGYYVCFASNSEVVYTSGFYFKPGEKDYKVIDKIDSEFVYQNPTFVIIPIDESDIQGNKIDVLKAFPDRLIQSIGGDMKVVNASLKTTTTSPQAVLLTQNIDHNLIPQEDIIYSSIPKIKVKGTSWIGTLGNKLKLDVWRGPIDEVASPTYNEDNGQITAPTLKYHTSYTEIRKKDCKNSNWVYVNWEFDPDWNMSENAQDFAMFSKHNLVGSASFTLKGTAGFKKEGTTIKPHFEASGSTSINVTVGGARFRAHKELPRRQVLSAIVGSAPTNQLYNWNGVNFNVKTIGIVDFFFTHYYTDL